MEPAREYWRSEFLKFGDAVELQKQLAKNGLTEWESKAAVSKTFTNTWNNRIVDSIIEVGEATPEETRLLVKVRDTIHREILASPTVAVFEEKAARAYSNRSVLTAAENLTQKGGSFFRDTGSMVKTVLSKKGLIGAGIGLAVLDGVLASAAEHGYTDESIFESVKSKLGDIFSGKTPSADGPGAINAKPDSSKKMASKDYLPERSPSEWKAHNKAAGEKAQADFSNS